MLDVLPEEHYGMIHCPVQVKALVNMEEVESAPNAQNYPHTLYCGNLLT